MSNAIVVPGLNSPQAYHNISWSALPDNWNINFKEYFGADLFSEYYKVNSFRSEIIRHTVYVYCQIASLKETASFDIYAFSLSEIICGLFYELISFEDFLKILKQIDDLLGNKKKSFLMWTVVGKECDILTLLELKGLSYSHKDCAILYSTHEDADTLISIMDKLCINYSINYVRYPFHSSLSPLVEKSITTTFMVTTINKQIKQNLFNLAGFPLAESLKSVCTIFNSKIELSEKLGNYSNIYEISNQIHLLSIVKHKYKNACNPANFKTIDSWN